VGGESKFDFGLDSGRGAVRGGGDCLVVGGHDSRDWFLGTAAEVDDDDDSEEYNYPQCPPDACCHYGTLRHWRRGCA